MRVLKTFLLALLVAALLLAAGGVLLVRRGFRATTAPSAWETVAARSLRGFSVPERERTEKSPLTASPDSQQQGRELFVTQCAACHGIDGSGKTQVGLNLYPRVPDL